jgi:anti-anti-sigma factor
MAKEFFRLLTVDSIGVIELELPHSLDVSEFDRLNDSILELLGGKTSARWVIDLSHVTYVGSSVLGLIVNIRQRVKAGNGQLALCGLSPKLHEIFRTSSMERLFNVARTRIEATKLLAK